ncbi:hypothetical protein T11_2673 [Trichinella zimbabwensis]|uniref:Uncharacterized protein n=1 Tax=Trichinella zimbabwensis TaxID=268475 RepID=A0A0V1GIE0_9BILA|nr:hypothetical protein T11_2673 [Trichinella zimbabwensis]
MLFKGELKYNTKNEGAMKIHVQRTATIATPHH